jgi:transposase InsO family protein
MSAEKAWPVAWMCKQFDVSRSGYYAWLERRPSARAQRDQQLAVKIAAVHKESRGTYGSPSIRDALVEDGEKVGKNHVARLMHQQGLSGNPVKKYKRTTDSAHDLPVAKNLVKRRFTVARPNQVWVADISYVWTWEGFLYLATIVDLYSRRVVGWATADHMRTELVLEALGMAVRDRQPPRGLIHHSDRGSQYASGAYQAALKAHGMRCSMSRKGDCWDNAVAESFFATLKRELIYRESWPTRARARAAINEYITSFYNRWRRHTALAGKSPMKYEAAMRMEALAA